MADPDKKPKAVQVGDIAPDFTIPDANGRQIRLSELLRSSVVVLFFYPKDGTPICTLEACHFRDAYQDFTDAGAEVVGISSDPAESHARFATRHRLPFLLGSDLNGEIRRLYGVRATLGILPGRVTYVIDRKGIVRHIFSSQTGSRKHVNEALKTVLSFGQNDPSSETQA